MDKPKVSKSFPLTSMPQSVVNIGDLLDVNSPLNDSSQSGKEAGSTYTTTVNGVSVLAVANGSKNTDEWTFMVPSSLYEEEPKARDLLEISWVNISGGLYAYQPTSSAGTGVVPFYNILEKPSEHSSADLGLGEITIDVDVKRAVLALAAHVHLDGRGGNDGNSFGLYLEINDGGGWSVVEDSARIVGVHDEDTFRAPENIYYKTTFYNLTAGTKIRALYFSVEYNPVNPLGLGSGYTAIYQDAVVRCYPGINIKLETFI